jgi:hypothetical protein
VGRLSRRDGEGAGGRIFMLVFFSLFFPRSFVPCSEMDLMVPPTHCYQVTHTQCQEAARTALHNQY